jgi:hypothetical protein
MLASDAGPTNETLTRTGAQRAGFQEATDDSRIAFPWRVGPSPLDRLAARGRIDESMHAAAETFARIAFVAQLDPLKASDPARVYIPGGGGRNEPPKIEAARKEVHRLMTALGGHGSPGADAIWHIVGCGKTVRDFALGQGWRGRPLDERVALGCLISSLAILARHLARR